MAALTCLPSHAAKSDFFSFSIPYERCIASIAGMKPVQGYMTVVNPSSEHSSVVRFPVNPC